MARYEHIDVGKPVNLEELKSRAKERTRRVNPRDDEIRRVINEAAAAPPSQAIPINLRDDQKLPTMRAAVKRLIKQSELPVNMAIRGKTVFLSRGSIPSGRGVRKS